MTQTITLQHPLHFFVPFSRVDEEQRIVEGYCYVNAKVASDKWNLKRAALEAATERYMEMPAVRAMHQPIAAGLGIGVAWDDKGALIRTKIVDDNEWNKVREKVYRGFSIGGRPTIVRGNDVEEFEWTETSLVDRPADPQAVFTMVRVDDANQPYDVVVKEEATTTTTETDSTVSTNSQEENSDGNNQLQQQPGHDGSDDGQSDERAAELAGGAEPGLAGSADSGRLAGDASGAPGRDERDVSAPTGSAGSDFGAVDAPVSAQSPDAAGAGGQPAEPAEREPGAERVDTPDTQRAETSADVPARENLEGGNARKPPVRRVHAYAHRMDSGEDCLHLNRADAVDHRDNGTAERVAVVQGTANIVGTFNDMIPVIESQDDFDDIRTILDTFLWTFLSTPDPAVMHQNVNELANYLDAWIGDEEAERADAAPVLLRGTAPTKKDSGHDSPPKGYPEDKSQYADPANYKYPIDTAEHAKAAWSYINKSDNQSEYSASELAYIKGRIKAACKKFGIDISSDSAERMEQADSLERVSTLTAELTTVRTQLETAQGEAVTLRADLATAKEQVQRLQKQRPQRFGTVERTFAANEQVDANAVRRSELVAEQEAIKAIDPATLSAIQRQDNTKRLFLIGQELARL